MRDQVRDLARQALRFQEMMVIGELDLKMIVETRLTGSVLPLRDSEPTADVVSRMEVVRGKTRWRFNSSIINVSTPWGIVWIGRLP